MIAAPLLRVRRPRFDVRLRPLLFFGGIAFLFFFRLGHRDLYSSHEARAAQNAQRMLNTGEWGIPVLFDGQVDLQKPPGYYWLVAAAGWLNGGTVTAFEARLPAALAGLFTVLMVFMFLQREGRPTAAWIAALVLATAVHFTAISRTARIDIPLTCAVTASLLLMYRGSWLAAVPAACGVILKGPIALALIGPVGVIWFWMGRVPTDRRRWALVGAPVLALLLSVPWFVWANHITGGEFYRVFILHHHVERFAGTSPALASHPWWYYLPRFAVDFLPWTPVLLVFVGPAVQAVFRLRDADGRHSRPYGACLLFGMIWFLTMFIVLSTAHFKRADYLLPLYPGAAIAIGCAVEAWIVRSGGAGSVSDGRKKKVAYASGSFLLLAIIGWVVMSFVIEPAEQAKEEKRAFAGMIREAAPPPNEILLFRTEPHLLAWHLGRPVRTRVEWHDLRAFCEPPGTHFVVMPPEYVDFAKHIVQGRKLVEAGRLEEYTADKPPRPLAFLRTE